MDDLFRSNRFLVVTIVLDVLLLGLLNSEVLPIRATPVVVGVALLVVSPAVAYAVVRATESGN